jgi:hypothetical protein
MAYDYDVAVYLGSLPKIANHNLKVQLMRAFAEGAKRAGARVWIGAERELKRARLAVMIGWIGMNFSGPHIYFRRDIVDHQKRTGGRVMPIDGSCFKFTSHENLWLRYSLDDVFYNTGEYANSDADERRWNQIRQSLDLKLDPWRTSGDHILICLQRDSGWNSKGFDQQHWLEKTCKIIRARSDRAIHIRPHPADRFNWNGIEGKFKDVYAINSKIRTLKQDIQGAHASVFFNSSSSVASVLHGVPVFVSDASAVTHSVANHNIKDINNPAMPPREQWLYELSAAHWTIEQSRSGDIYRHFEPYLPPA